MVSDIGMPRPDTFNLRDKYTVERGTVLLSGIQALVRVPLDRHRADARAGLRTGTFLSGYQGSPLGGLDLAVTREAGLMAGHDIHLVPGVNEELAATAVWGSQQSRLGELDGRDGVVGIWYGKAPGVDRCGDVFKHGNLMGVAPNGGVLVLAGDDPVSKSSTIPSASETALADAQIPVLFPGNPQEILDLGMHAVAMSRFSGLWVGMKLVTNVADGFGTADVAPDRIVPVLPPVEIDGRPWHYVQGGLALPPRNLDDERDLAYGRLEAARAYTRANRLNEVTATGGYQPRVGIVAAGKTYHDVVQALRELGVDDLDTGLARLGVRLLRLGITWPLEPEIVRTFAQGLDEIVVVEEKRSFVELQLRDALYDLDIRPRVVGKHDEKGRTLVPADGELTPDRIAPLLAARLGDPLTGAPVPRARERIALLERPPAAGRGPAAELPARAPYFCSGCPHNRSTLVPEGSVAGGGIGCHTMAALIGRSAVAMTQMGGEGAEWIGRAPFTDRPHLFQNLGDGTLFHSGSMAIRQCIAAGVNITYKVLYNGTVAMTGGQDASGGVPVPELTRILEAEGVVRTIVCAEEPEHYPERARWARNVDVWPRERLDEAQLLLRDVEGVTVIVYDQECAAEKRRARKRGKVEAPPLHVFINERVCEGCGDCGVKSNCLSVQPVDTEFGRKTRIHQSSCNQDFTCLDGDCPSFVTVTETRRSRRRARARLERERASRDASRDIPVLGDDFPEPDAATRATVDGLFNLYLTGVGGTGVVTISQLLATAALLDGFQVAGLDQTGLSQKGGPVVSHVKLARDPIDASNAVAAGEADTYLGFDLLVAADPRHLAQLRPGSRAVVSTSKVPTGAMVTDAGLGFPAVDGLLAAVAGRTGGGDVHLDAIALAEGLFRDHMMANLVLVGAAYQTGAIPVSAASLERAIELNGVAVDENRQAFRWGRRYVLDPAAALAAAGTPAVDPVPVALLPSPPRPATELERVVELRSRELGAYQSARSARDYTDFVSRVAGAERTAVPGSSALAEAVARNLFKLMAYKDEYEVAAPDPRPRARRRAPRPVPRRGPRALPPAPSVAPVTRDEAQGRAGPLVEAGVPHAARHAPVARHPLRRVRPHEGPAHRAGTDRRVPRDGREGPRRPVPRHDRPRRAARGATRRGARLRADQARQRRRLPRAGPHPRLLNPSLQFLGTENRKYCGFPCQERDGGLRRSRCRRRPRGRAR